MPAGGVQQDGGEDLRKHPAGRVRPQQRRESLTYVWHTSIAAAHISNQNLNLNPRPQPPTPNPDARHQGGHYGRRGQGGGGRSRRTRRGGPVGRLERRVLLGARGRRRAR